MKVKNPNENLAIPEWVNAAYFEPIVAKDVSDYAKIKSCAPIAAIAPGENFTSVMIRVHIQLEMKDGSWKHKSYILKTMLDDDKGGEMINKLSLFPKELQMYQKYLPAFEKLYENAGEKLQLSAKCLFIEQKDSRINLVFEDLSCQPRSFRNIDRLQGFNMDAMTHTMRKLAEFHAASAVYEEQNGAYPKEFLSGFIDPEMGLEFQKMTYDNKQKDFVEAIPQWQLEEGKKYAEKFVSILKNFLSVDFLLLYVRNSRLSSSTGSVV